MKRLSLAAMVLLAGCGTPVWDRLAGNSGDNNRDATDPSPGDDREPVPPPYELTGTLEGFDGCETALTSLRRNALNEMNRILDQQIDYARKSQGPVTGAIPQAEDSGAASAAPAPGYTTGTNNQVSGLDEPDVVKHDGSLTYHLTKGKLRVVQSWPPEQMGHKGSLAVHVNTSSMLYLGDHRLALLSQIYGQNMMGRPMEDGAFLPGERASPDAHILIVDARNSAAPVEAGRYTVPGSVLGARRFADTFLVAVSSTLPMPEGVITFPRDFSFYSLSLSEQIRWYEDRRAKNTELISAATLEQLIPPVQHQVAAATSQYLPGERSCSGIHMPSASSSAGLTRLLAFGNDGLLRSETILLASSQMIYVSPEAAYLAMPYFWPNGQSGGSDYTFIHAFGLAATQPYVGYLGSGGVEGTPINQFAMDRHDGHLRIATTIRTIDPANWSMSTVSRLSVFGHQQGGLQLMGQTPDLAPGERIYSVRFTGDKGWLVTFRQVDPLFSLDLTDPANPRVIGELKIPGFSNYIHPVDDGRLLTLGYEASEDTGMVTGTKISLFDIRRPEQVLEADKIVLSREHFSIAQSDHHAFMWDAPAGIMAIPASGYRTGDDGQTVSWEAVQLFRLNQLDLEEIGHLDVTDLTYPDPATGIECWGGYSSTRSFVSDQYIYAVTNCGLRVAQKSAPDLPLATLRYPL